MNVVKCLIWRIGVAIAVAPVFFIVPAQAQSSSSNSVLEMQQLRQEIAELRDMIERQQYQIRQLQRQAQSAPASSRAASPEPVLQNSQPAIQNPANDAGIDGGQTIPGDFGSRPADSYPVEVNNPAIQAPAEQASSNPNAGYSNESGGWTQGSGANPGVSEAQQSEEDFYRPYNSDGSLANANPEVVSAARQARQASDTYPPVVDRSVGRPASSQSATPSTASPSSGAGSVSSTFPAVGTGTVVSQTSTSASNTSQPRAESPVTNTNGAVDSPSQGQNQPAVSGGSQAGVIPIPSTNNSPAVSQPVANAPTTIQPAPQIVLSEADLYQQGFDLLKEFKYDDAVAVFEQQLEQYPSGGYADDANYWIAESMYLNRNLAESKKYFRVIIDDFSQSPRVPDAMLKTAYIEQDQGNEIEARILLQEIIQYHPRSDAAISAKNRLEKLQ